MIDFARMAKHARQYKDFHEGSHGLVGDDAAAVMFNMIAIIAEHLAQGTPTRSAETAGLGPKDGGPVTEGDAPEPPQVQP